MYLIVDELDTTIDQDIILSRPMELVHIRPYIYKHASPIGGIKVSIRKDGAEITSNTLAISYIDANLATPGTYYHGFIRFTMDEVVRLPRDTYTIRLEGVDGYSYNPSAFIGWVQEYENRTNRPTDSTVEFLENPHSVQLWSYKWASEL